MYVLQSNNPYDLQPIDGQTYQLNAGLIYISPQTEVGWWCGRHVESPSWDYRYQTVATQIPHVAGLSPTRSVGNRTWDRFMRGSDSTSALQQWTYSYYRER